MKEQVGLIAYAVVLAFFITFAAIHIGAGFIIGTAVGFTAGIAFQGVLWNALGRPTHAGNGE